MGEVKQINIKYRTYCYYNDMINLKHFEPNLLNITKGLIFTTLDTSQLKKIDDYESIYSVNPLSLLINHTDGYIKEKREINTWFLMILLMKTKSYC